MIQRIQSVYMLLSAIAAIVCACLPIATIEPSGMGPSHIVYNLCITDGGVTDFMDVVVAPLFLILMASAVLSVINIFKYNNRMKQSRNCVVNIVLLILWGLYYAFMVYLFADDDLTFTPAFAAALPAVALILQWMARRGIIHDEKLVRAADRIR